jgi:selenide,water dikinase
VGSGVLFAVAMAAAAKAHWIDQALAVLQQSQAPLVELLAAQGCRACTDITGFGLLGHLGEMLAASPDGTRVQLDANALAGLALPGALELLAAGHTSTLTPANAQALALLESPVSLPGDASAPLQQLLIDPQTCGPLLAAVPAERAAAAIAALQQQGFPRAAVIGQVMA